MSYTSPTLANVGVNNSPLGSLAGDAISATEEVERAMTALRINDSEINRERFRSVMRILKEKYGQLDQELDKVGVHTDEQRRDLVQIKDRMEVADERARSEFPGALSPPQNFEQSNALPGPSNLTRIAEGRNVYVNPNAVSSPVTAVDYKKFFHIQEAPVLFNLESGKLKVKFPWVIGTQGVADAEGCTLKQLKNKLDNKIRAQRGDDVEGAKAGRSMTGKLFNVGSATKKGILNVGSAALSGTRAAGRAALTGLRAAAAAPMTAARSVASGFAPAVAATARGMSSFGARGGKRSNRSSRKHRKGSRKAQRKNKTRRH